MYSRQPSSCGVMRVSRIRECMVGPPPVLQANVVLRSAVVRRDRKVKAVLVCKFRANGTPMRVRFCLGQLEGNALFGGLPGERRRERFASCRRRAGVFQSRCLLPLSPPKPSILALAAPTWARAVFTG